MGTNECSQPASKSSWDGQDFGDVNMVLKMVHFDKSSRPQWVNWKQILKVCYPIKMGNHSNIVHSRLPLPPN